MIRKELLEEKIINEPGLLTELFDIISYSTNDRVKELIKDGKERTVVATECQEGGRGRIGREWTCPADSLALSFSSSPNVDTKDLSRLALLAALATSNTLGKSVNIKWPNDITYLGKKVAGILCELFQCNGRNYVIVGIGINFDLGSTSSKNLQNAASIKEAGIVITKEEAIAGIYNSFSSYVKEYEQKGFGTFAKEYNERLAYIGDEINILDSSVSGGDIERAALVISGICEGVNDNGELIVSSEGTRHLISSGELSLRKA